MRRCYPRIGSAIWEQNAKRCWQNRTISTFKSHILHTACFTPSWKIQPAAFVLRKTSQKKLINVFVVSNFRSTETAKTFFKEFQNSVFKLMYVHTYWLGLFHQGNIWLVPICRKIREMKFVAICTNNRCFGRRWNRRKCKSAWWSAVIQCPFWKLFAQNLALGSQSKRAVHWKFSENCLLWVRPIILKPFWWKIWQCDRAASLF